MGSFVGCCVGLKAGIFTAKKMYEQCCLGVVRLEAIARLPVGRVCAAEWWVKCEGRSGKINLSDTVLTGSVK